VSIPFILLLALAFILVWGITSTIFWRMSRSKNSSGARLEVQPAIRLAEQWLADAQGKMQQLVENAEQPLSTAQNELLELRLEAGRLPQGIKNLKLVREALNGPSQPRYAVKNLEGIVRLFLGEEGHRVEGPDLVFLATSLGEMACLEMGAGPLDDALRSALARISRAAGQNPATGGFLYFQDPARYRECLRNAQWMEGIKSQRLMLLDAQGLSALLLSLKLSRDANRVVEVFQGGVDSTRALTGQSDRMGAALSQLSADSIKLRTLVDGSGHGP